VIPPPWDFNTAHFRQRAILSIRWLQCAPSLAHCHSDPEFEGRQVMSWRQTRSMDFRTLVVLASMWLFIYAAWLTSIVFCSANAQRGLLIAAAAFFPIGVVHGIGVWFGGW
jgi:hypothetical protein